MVLVWLGMDGLRGQFGHEMEWNCKGVGFGTQSDGNENKKLGTKYLFLTP